MTQSDFENTVEHLRKLNFVEIHEVRDFIDTLLETDEIKSGQFYKILHRTYIIVQINEHEWVLVNRYGQVGARFNRKQSDIQLRAYLKLQNAKKVSLKDF